MIIHKYGLSLSSLTVADLELVRKWRNSEFVRNLMLFREPISSKMQGEWFASLDQESVYLLIKFQSEKIGLINVKNISWNERSGEAGIFIGSEKHRNTIVPVLSIFALMDTFFEQFKFNSLSAKVVKNNSNALAMNLELGYQIKIEKKDYIELEIRSFDYEKQTRTLKSKLGKLSSFDCNLELSEEEKELFF